MKLRRPTIFLKINTTGFNPETDRIVELSMSKYDLDNDEVVLRESGARRFNPNMTMSDEVIGVHGITNEELMSLADFSYYAHKIYNFIGDCDIIGFGIKDLDILFLRKEFSRCGYEFNMNDRMIVDLMEIYMKKEPRDLMSAALFYADKKIDNSIIDKTNILPEIFQSMLNKYEDIGSLEAACKISFNGNIPVDIDGFITIASNGEYVFNYGKNKGLNVGKVCYEDVGYYNWIMNKSGFSNETKSIVLWCFNSWKAILDNQLVKQDYIM